jgi:hypothetical protein
MTKNNPPQKKAGKPSKQKAGKPATPMVWHSHKTGNRVELNPLAMSIFPVKLSAGNLLGR